MKPPDGVKFIRIESAVSMRRAVLEEFKRHDCLIMAAAVCDWRVKKPLSRKLKRSGKGICLELAENPDILEEAGRQKGGRVLVGFALETDNLAANVADKLRKKNLDIIVANSLTPKTEVFGPNKTDVLIIDRHGHRKTLKNMSKKILAEIILDKAASFDVI